VSDADKRVVRVHQQRDVVRLGIGVGIEGALLVVKDLDPRVGVCAPNGDAEKASRQNIGGSGHAADICGPRGGKRAVRSLGPT
jgi:hypothetical protein